MTQNKGYEEFKSYAFPFSFQFFWNPIESLYKLVSCISVQTQISILEISDCLFHQIITTNMETMDTSIILFEFYGILIYTNNVLSMAFQHLDTCVHSHFQCFNAYRSPGIHNVLGCNGWGHLGNLLNQNLYKE